MTNAYKVVHLAGECCGDPQALLSACGLLWSTSKGATRDSYTTDPDKVTCMASGCRPGRYKRALFYIQDTRTIIGNCALWWKPEGAGYTCDLEHAGKYTVAMLTACCLRDTDKAWPAEFVDPQAQRHVHTDGLRGPTPRESGCSAATPCCSRVGEYNGFHTGSHLFECPKNCPCHD